MVRYKERELNPMPNSQEPAPPDSSPSNEEDTPTTPGTPGDGGTVPDENPPVGNGAGDSSPGADDELDDAETDDTVTSSATRVGAGDGRVAGMEDDEENEDDEEWESPEPSRLSKLLHAIPSIPEYPFPKPIPTLPVAGEVEPVKAESDDILALAPDDEEYLFGTEDPLLDMGDDMDETISGMSPATKQYLFGTGLTKEQQEALDAKEQVLAEKRRQQKEAAVEDDKNMDEFLFSVDHELLDTGDEVKEEDLATDEFLFGTKHELLDFDDAPQKTRKKTKYTAGKKARSTKMTKKEREEADDEFLFGTKTDGISG